MADNPVSWFLLMIVGFYFMYHFLRKAFLEYEERRKERGRYVDQLFFENNVDKSNAQAYNRYQKNFGREKFKHY